MKRRYRIYLETSFWDRLGDRQNLEMRRITYRFLNRSCRIHDILVSPIVCHEIEETPDPQERTIIQRQLQGTRAEVVGENAKARRIAGQLLERGGFGERMLADLLHVSYAILGRANAMVTWDRRTLARQGVRTVVQAYCAREGRAAPLIGVPEDVARWLELAM
jgi:hypothetical protein